MSNADLFVSATYVLYIAAPAIRDELWLRTALFLNSIGFALWGAWIGAYPVVAANLLFCLMSLRQMRRAWLARRPVALDADTEMFGRALFPAMSPRELERFWAAGTNVEVDHVQLTTIGREVEDLSLVMEGDVHVRLADGSNVTAIGPLMVGEVTTLNPDIEGATATVSVDQARLRRWSKEDLAALQAENPELVAPLVQGLASIMAGRVKRQARRVS